MPTMPGTAETQLELCRALHPGQPNEDAVAALDQRSLEAVGVGADHTGLVAPVDNLAIEPD